MTCFRNSVSAIRFVHDYRPVFQLHHAAIERRSAVSGVLLQPFRHAAFQEHADAREPLCDLSSCDERFLCIGAVVPPALFRRGDSALTTLVVIGFIGGLGLLLMLLAIAFWRNGIVKLMTWAFKLAGKMHIVKDPEKRIVDTTKTIETRTTRCAT